ncbi:MULTISPECIES: helix-turn-helix domain-containing protein [Streptomyces]|uniref:Transcriptional regulator with XRE-family HTH domain n=1 Tax=Streptomyces clavifer TaxID=68188 RepID=A0ABS4VGG9_9ACTN|nr:MULTISPECIES: XRE family transcriptional regulator [Streptomyces]MBP2362873.1 transcriptional regulator with XRE-family HTH domain [Streptomyces clavifer]MDX2742845.1 XRE family transcriptional regulator [Streptomyces sp. NRRL_B-2557]
MTETVIDRVRGVMDAASLSQTAFAERVGLSPDKLSKSLSGVRRFSSLDLARIAEATGTTVDYLLGGREPVRPRSAARSGGAVAEGARWAEVEAIACRFQNAYDVLDLLGRPRAIPDLPQPRPELERYVDQGEHLAADFTEHLARQGAGAPAGMDLPSLTRLLADHCGIDVALVDLPVQAALSGATWQSDAFRIVLLATTQEWTRARFTLAHEVGHLLARDAQDLRADAVPEPGRQKDYSEVRANVFAAHFLMPEAEVRAVWERTVTDRNAPTDAELSELVVAFKVSPSALAARLHRIGLLDTARRNRFRGFTTEICHVLAGRLDDHYRHRAESAVARPPLVPMAELHAAYEAGETTLRPLAAYLDRSVDDLRAILEPSPAPRALPEDERGDPVFQP